MKVYVTEVTKRMHGGAIGAVQKLATGGSVVRNMLGGGFFPGFGGGDRRHVLAEDGEYMLNKFATAEMGLAAATYANNRDWPALVRELVSRFGLDVGSLIRRATGGVINSVPLLPPMPQLLASGGSVVGGGASSAPVYNLAINVTGSPASGDAIGRQVVSALERMHRRSSR